MRGGYMRFQAQYLRRICIPMHSMLGKSQMDRLRKLDKSEDLNAVDLEVGKVYGLSKKEVALARNTSAPKSE